MDVNPNNIPAPPLQQPSSVPQITTPAAEQTTVAPQAGDAFVPDQAPFDPQAALGQLRGPIDPVTDPDIIRWNDSIDPIKEQFLNGDQQGALAAMIAINTEIDNSTQVNDPELRVATFQVLSAVRHTIGDMLFTMGRPEDALVYYEAAVDSFAPDKGNITEGLAETKTAIALVQMSQVANLVPPGGLIPANSEAATILNSALMNLGEARELWESLNGQFGVQGVATVESLSLTGGLSNYSDPEGALAFNFAWTGHAESLNPRNESQTRAIDAYMNATSRFDSMGMEGARAFMLSEIAEAGINRGNEGDIEAAFSHLEQFKQIMLGEIQQNPDSDWRYQTVLERMAVQVGLYQASSEDAREDIFSDNLGINSAEQIVREMGQILDQALNNGENNAGREAAMRETYKVAQLLIGDLRADTQLGR